MAKLDLTGLMTGLPTDQDLRTQGQARAAQIQGGGLGSNLARGIASRAPQREEMMRQGLGGMFGVDTRTGDQQQTARMQQALSGLNLDTPEGLMQLAKIQQSTGDMAGAAQSIAAARALTEEKRVSALRGTQQVALGETRAQIAAQLRSIGGFDKVADAVEKEQGSGSQKALDGAVKIITNLAQKPSEKNILTPDEQFTLFRKETQFKADVETVSTASDKAAERFDQYGPILSQMNEITSSVNFGTGSTTLAEINNTLYSLGTKIGLELEPLDPNASATATYDSLSKRLKAMLLEAQKGAISNLENAEITKNTANPNMSSNQAQALVNFTAAGLDSNINRTNSQRTWLDDKGSLSGFNAAWKQYVEDFPRTAGFLVDEDPNTGEKTVVANFEPVKENMQLFDALYKKSNGKSPVFVDDTGKGKTLKTIKEEIRNDQLAQLKSNSNNPNWKPTKAQLNLIELNTRRNVGKLINLRLANKTLQVTQ